MDTYQRCLCIHHEDMCGIGCRVPICSLTLRYVKNLLYSREKFPRKTMNTMLTAPQTQSGYFRSEKNQFLMSGIEPILLEHLAHSLAHITTTLTRFTAPKIFILSLKNINI